jgi:hypothetical protein
LERVNTFQTLKIVAYEEQQMASWDWKGLKKLTITETIRLHRLRWFGHVQRMEENRIPKRVSYMNLETTKPRGRRRNRWQDEVWDDERSS